MKSTANFPEQVHYHPATSLEGLPSEIIVMILCHMPEASSLSSIVHASPICHEAYLGAREEILHNVTIQTLQKNNTDLLDPWTAIHAPQLGYNTPHRTEIISDYLLRYAQGRMDGSRRRLAPQDSLAILRLQRRFTILITNYCEAIFSKNPFTELSDGDPLLPSQSELHRLYRALWRYEIYSHFFGPYIEAHLSETSMFGEVDIAHNFFGLFPIHEVEELACLQKFARDYYYPLSGEEDELVALGPKYLFEVMTAESENQRKTRIDEGENAGRPDTTMRAALDAYERDVNWGDWQWRGMYDKFVSERVPTTGWLWASSHGVQNTDFRLRRWGYVFWDQERLEGWGITEKNMVDWPYPRRRIVGPEQQT